ncbi:MAG: leucyl aminopeptidase, partial [Deltaproteobacteria bacterium]|nr:leucyl aminopeptidase [Deltaproteobacteria bacterium]
MIELKSTDIRKRKTATLAVPLCEDETIHSGAVQVLAEQAATFEEFDGKAGEELVLHNPPGVKADRVIFMGLGKRSQVRTDTLRTFAGRAVKACIQRKLSGVMIAAPSASSLNLETDAVLEALLEGAYLGNHRFDKYKQEKKLIPLKRMGVLTTPGNAKKQAALVPQVAAVCAGTLLAREWVSTPSNDKRPGAFARMLVREAKKANLKTRVLTEKELRQGKYGAILAVGQGSEDKPRLVEIVYAPKGAKKTVALVGKGVTFDTGGINLKPSAGIEDMKIDMSGAAAVAATMLAVARLKPRVKIAGVIPIVENMPSGSATRPGDIVTSYAGKTVEIGNTDAEGRLILIDAMTHALKRFKPDVMVDIATLTGACMVALGEKVAGVFSHDDELAEAIVAAGRKTHERTWRLPLPEDYKDLLKSDIADLNNMSSSRYGGAITAALFLSEFAGQARWAHIDIAGPAHIKKGMPTCEAGGTGFGVR